jgi:hypothetical protein
MSLNFVPTHVHRSPESCNVSGEVEKVNWSFIRTISDVCVPLNQLTTLIYSKVIHLTQNSTTDMVICRNHELEECLDHF